MAVLLTLCPVSAQVARSSGAGFQEEVSVGYVLVPIVARRAKGGYATDLKPEDFRLLVNGQVVDFESFEQGDRAPVSVMFLQDLSGSMANSNKIDLSRSVLDRLVMGHRPGDNWGLTSFASDRVSVDVPFTDNIGLLRQSADAWRPYGTTALHDAVAWLPDLTADVQSARRAAIVLTDGVDNASKIDPYSAREKVRQAELPVYVLGLSTGDIESLDRDGEKVYRYADVLNLLSHLTGGQYFPVAKQSDAILACNEIVSEIRNQYVIGFPTSALGTPTYHEIVVQPRNKKNLELTFRHGYTGTLPKALVPSRQ
jgi:Ca-activated chloride channel family protein